MQRTLDHPDHQRPAGNRQTDCATSNGRTDDAARANDGAHFGANRDPATDRGSDCRSRRAPGR